VKLELSPDDLKPIVAEAVAQAIEQLRGNELRFAEQFGFPEAQAASLIGVRPHVLRDLRLKGLAKAKRVGRGYLWHRNELERLLREGAGE